MSFIQRALHPTSSISNNKYKKLTTCCHISQFLQKKKNYLVFWCPCCHCMAYFSNSDLRTCDDTTIIRHRETFYNDRGFSDYICLDLSLFCFVFWISLTSAGVIKMHFKKYKSFQCNVIRNMNSDLGLIDGVWSNERNNRKWKLIVAVDRDNREIMHISMCSFQQ